MKTKKVLALVVLAAFLISIVPFAAFAEVNPYYSAIDVTTSTASATSTVDEDSEGAEFEVIKVGTGPIFVASSRPGATFFFYEKDDKWEELDNNTILDGMGESISGNTSIKIKAVYTASGTTQIVFGVKHADIAESYALGRDFPTVTIGTPPASYMSGLEDIIGNKRYPVEFTAPSVGSVELVQPSPNNNKPANGIDTYTLSAYVRTNPSGGAPVAGEEVQFRITEGTGTLTASRATTNVAGKAEVKIYSQKVNTVKVVAKAGGKDSTPVEVSFVSTGIVSIKAESDNNQKVARTGTSAKTFKFSAYDASGSRVPFTVYKSDGTTPTVTKTVVSKPSGATLTTSRGFDIKADDGYGVIEIAQSSLNKDGEYEVRVHLDNGVAVSYKFSAKEQGDIVDMKLKYASSSYAAGSSVKSPKVEYLDAEGYAVEEAVDANVRISASDASFIDGSITNGAFTLKEDKTGVLTMTAVNTTENLVATQVLNIEKAASYLKLTPQSVGAVGGEVTVKVELVDVDGKPVSNGVEAASDGARAMTIAPQGVIASATIDADDFEKGKAEVKVTSNTEGDVVVRVIITEEDDVDYEGKTYTGAATVSFGKASAGGGQLIFIIGAPSFVSGNQVYASESPSFIENGRTFLGVRDMGTSIGATVEWDQASQTASLSKDGVTVKVTVGASKIAVTKNGVTSEIEIDAPAQNKNGRVYLPFRAVLEAFNYTVAYDQATNSIVCTL